MTALRFFAGSVEDVILIAKWLACMYRSLDEFHEDHDILTLMKSQKILPLSDGELVSLEDKTVFYPIPDSNQKRKSETGTLQFLPLTGCLCFH